MRPGAGCSSSTAWTCPPDADLIQFVSPARTGHYTEPVNTRRPPALLLRCLVLLSLWFGALAPALSQAIAAERGELTPFTQVCRASLVSPRAQQGDWPGSRRPAVEDHGLSAHCMFCGAHQQDLALPPPSLQARPVAEQVLALVPARFLSAPALRSVWQPAQSRGPPTGSVLL